MILQQAAYIFLHDELRIQFTAYYRMMFNEKHFTESFYWSKSNDFIGIDTRENQIGKHNHVKEIPAAGVALESLNKAINQDKYFSEMINELND
jgi:hypothetical protein